MTGQNRFWNSLSPLQLKGWTKEYSAALTKMQRAQTLVSDRRGSLAVCSIRGWLCWERMSESWFCWNSQIPCCSTIALHGLLFPSCLAHNCYSFCFETYPSVLNQCFISSADDSLRLPSHARLAFSVRSLHFLLLFTANLQQELKCSCTASCS